MAQEHATIEGFVWGALFGVEAWILVALLLLALA